MGASNSSCGGLTGRIPLPSLARVALDWAREAERSGLAKGKTLAFWQLADARDVGVLAPERVRVCLVDDMPRIRDGELAAAAAETGLLSQNTVGLALGYAIYIHRDRAGWRSVLRHELRHVAQCEQAGGLDGFVPEYLRQIAAFGYPQAPYEIDARRHETRPPGS